MRTTIDSAGRIVVPKRLRDALHLTGGETLELEVRDGRLEAEPLATPMRLRPAKDGGVAAVADHALAPLTTEEVRETLEQTRR